MGLTGLKIKVLIRLCSLLKALGENYLPISFILLVNSVHCGYKTEHPVSSQAISLETFLLP